LLPSSGHATTDPVSAPEPAIRGAQAAQDAATAWKDVRADPSIQFGPLPVDLPSQAPLPSASGSPVPIQTVPKPPPPEPSHLGEWLRQIFEPIGKALGLAWPVMQWVLIAIGAALVLYAMWRLIAPWLARRSGTRADDLAQAAAWSPDRAAAQQLLGDADALAAKGKFAEATHLLLKRSVEHIAAARPDWVLPASTTREISALPALPETARSAFGLIAQRVEISLFALRQLNQGDWQAARAAYADFALEQMPQGPVA
jgi:hypothetical protein